MAGAFEAMNSTGGQIMLPVMGARAFLMAEILAISYTRVAAAAIIPSLFYFLAAYWMIDFCSAAAGLKGISLEELPVFHNIMLEKGYLLVPIVVLLVSLIVVGWEVGWQGIRFAIASFLVPYTFFLGPAMI